MLWLHGIHLDIILHGGVIPINDSSIVYDESSFSPDLTTTDEELIAVSSDRSAVPADLSNFVFTFAAVFLAVILSMTLVKGKF